MRTLFAALLVLLAGCTAGPLAGTPTESIPTPSGDCAATTPSPDGSAEVSPRAWPDPPENRSIGSVGSYVVEFERAYLHNERLEPGTQYLETHVELEHVTPRGDLYLVRLTSYTNGGIEQSTPDAGTPITVHWDGAPHHVAYLLTEGRLLRAQGDRETTPSPEAVAEGPTVACV
ncbi:hypothetical protein [Halorarius halobius]|uniref:hypothetical protein n=1 Tax=Halorarius halobius TaxID=2962671 RepID=UPI0020CF332E|nr:hypothetical protein [Halorarius halobius]